MAFVSRMFQQLKVKHTMLYRAMFSDRTGDHGSSGRKLVQTFKPSLRQFHAVPSHRIGLILDFTALVC